MTAYVTIPVATVEDVVKLPNAALRFKPPISPDEVHALYARAGIDESRNGDDAGTSTRAGAGSASAAPAPRDGGARGAVAVVWKSTADGVIEPVQVSLGITDHAYTEITQVLHGALKSGDDVVTTAVSSKSPAPGPQGIRR
jgi:HlyD family secretion protein